MTALDELAEDIGVSVRTLQRAVAGGTIRATSLGPRRRHVSAREQRFVRRTWPLLSRLRAGLRTEPNVDLAVLFGSVARGSGEERSDVDLAVRFRQRRPSGAAELAQRLSASVGRPVQIVDLDRARDHASLWRELMRDGRPLVDRTGAWSALPREDDDAPGREPTDEIDAIAAEWDD